MTNPAFFKILVDDKSGAGCGVFISREIGIIGRLCFSEHEHAGIAKG
jgi:hypothetical protein